MGGGWWTNPEWWILCVLAVLVFAVFRRTAHAERQFTALTWQMEQHIREVNRIVGSLHDTLHKIADVYLVRLAPLEPGEHKELLQSIARDLTRIRDFGVDVHTMEPLPVLLKETK